MSGMTIDVKIESGDELAVNGDTVTVPGSTVKTISVAVPEGPAMTKEQDIIARYASQLGNKSGIQASILTEPGLITGVAIDVYGKQYIFDGSEKEIVDNIIDILEPELFTGNNSFDVETSFEELVHDNVFLPAEFPAVTLVTSGTAVTNAGTTPVTPRVAVAVTYVWLENRK